MRGRGGAGGGDRHWGGQPWSIGGGILWGGGRGRIKIRAFRGRSGGDAGGGDLRN